MDGDLSLSQSLGGLRIANPDDSLPSGYGENSDQRPEGAASGYRHDWGHDSPLRPTNLSYNSSTVPSNPTSNPNSSAHSHPHSSQPSNILPYQDHPHYSSRRQHNVSSQDLDGLTSHSARPPSTYFPAGLPHEPSSNVPPHAGSYRARAESGASSASDNILRNEPRGGAAPPPVQSRMSVQGPNGPVANRRSSRQVQNSGVSQLSGSPYSMDGGVLSSAEDWQDRGAAVSVRQEVDSSGKTVSRYVKKGVRDFSFGRTLGEGSYSTVIAATDRQTLREYAIKILDKRHIIKEKKVKYVNIEKNTLNRLTDHPGVVRLYYTFQDERSLYFVLDLASGGELLGVLKRMGTFDEECARFYAAQVLDTVDYMHRRGVIHRDLKPENVLLDTHMHVKITDFGTAKILDPPKRPEDSDSPAGIPQMDTEEDEGEERAKSFVGTAEYVSPELLTDKNACKASDLWAFGCIIFQLLAGRPPFKAGNEYQTFQKIVSLNYEFPKGFPPVARDLVERLLVIDPASRLQIEHIKNHEFFDGVIWGRGLWKLKAPRLKPYVPPPPEPIKLNGGSKDDSYPPSVSNNRSGLLPSSNAGSSRPYPRVITDLPPPSQLDIEWSPVLTGPNERILKLGNLTVSSSSLPNGGGNGDGDAPKKLSRFFGGATGKKRPRLVLVTSAGRVIVVAAGGDDKKPKLDISLLAPETQYRSVTDAKGHSSWTVDTRDKRHTFEETKSASADGTSALSIQEWVDALDRAKETAAFHNTPNNPRPRDGSFRDLSSGVSSHSNTLNQSDELPGHKTAPGGGGGRAALTKQQPGGSSDADTSRKDRKRFSRRHSKNGLSAIF